MIIKGSGKCSSCQAPTEAAASMPETGISRPPSIMSTTTEVVPTKDVASREARPQLDPPSPRAASATGDAPLHESGGGAADGSVIDIGATSNEIGASPGDEEPDAAEEMPSEHLDNADHVDQRVTPIADGLYEPGERLRIELCHGYWQTGVVLKRRRFDKCGITDHLIRFDLVENSLEEGDGDWLDLTCPDEVLSVQRLGT